MIVLLIFVILCSVVGVGLVVAMYRRDEPLFGAIALAVLLMAAIAALVYGILSSVGTA